MAHLPDPLPSCDNEPIHLLARIQSFGFLVVVAADWTVRQASANLAQHLGMDAGDVCGRALTEVLPRQAVHAIRGALQALAATGAVERLFDVMLWQGHRYDLAVHRSGTSIVIEGEVHDASDRMDAALSTHAMVARLQHPGTLLQICQEAARQVRALTGFDRVMIYRFGDDGAGEVIAERAQSMMEPFLGLHYPATDIPRQARELYLRNTLRIVSDVDDPCVAILPATGVHDEPLDLSLSMLRAVSPVHLAYLRNMGVAASMSISILHEGNLWGLIACHHGTPRRLSLSIRTAAELFGQVFSLLIEQRQREMERTQALFNSERLARITASLATDGTVYENLATAFDEIRGLVTCDGFSVLADGQTHVQGGVPGHADMRAIVAMLDERPSRTSFATDRLRELLPGIATTHAGLLAIPVSGLPGDYLLFFRGARDHWVTWAGDPDKAARGIVDGLRPRESFAAWNQLVEGRSEPFDRADLRLAEHVRVSLLEVVSRLSEAADRARRKAASRRDILVGELNHRVRNIFSLVRGLVAQSRDGATHVEEFIENVSGRIQSLSRAHDLATADPWDAAPLADLLRAEVHAWLEPGRERVAMSGPPVLLAPHAFSTMALVMHEMVTNAAKYGALAQHAGHIAIEWSIAESASLLIEWREAGGPLVSPPSRRGFGSTIIERSIPFDLKGTAELDHAPGGVRARFTIPPAFFRVSELPVVSTPVIHPPIRQTLAGEVMVLEDNLIIALDAEDILRSLGASLVHATATVAEAFDIIRSRSLTFALLDFDLGDDTSLVVAERLQALGIPFMFASGYGSELPLPPAMAHCHVVTKPYTLASFQD